MGDRGTLSGTRESITPNLFLLWRTGKQHTAMLGMTTVMICMIGMHKPIQTRQEDVRMVSGVHGHVIGAVTVLSK